MGLYDRDYIREDDQPGIFAGGQYSMVTILIAINVGVYLIDMLMGNTLIPKLEVRADVFREPWYAWQLLTYGFAHDPNDFRHILFNMLYLWFFGRDVEVIYGRKEFLRLYLSLTVLSGLVWALIAFALHNPRPLIGASGAVVGVTILFVLR
ncbi:MAG: rhomboid family intramembrane serine protease, partial [Pirellulales bacterium]